MIDETLTTRHLTSYAEPVNPYTQEAMSIRLAELDKRAAKLEVEGAELAAEAAILQAALKALKPTRKKLTREAWVKLVQDNPGLTAIELDRRTGLSCRSTLSRMAIDGVLSRSGTPHRYWVAGAGPDDVTREKLAAALGEATGAIPVEPLAVAAPTLQRDEPVAVPCVGNGALPDRTSSATDVTLF